LARKAKKKDDAVMTGILVTRFKMGLIDVEHLEKKRALPESGLWPATFCVGK
jgi:hypothetical protein